MHHLVECASALGHRHRDFGNRAFEIGRDPQHVLTPTGGEVAFQPAAFGALRIGKAERLFGRPRGLFAFRQRRTDARDQRIERSGNIAQYACFQHHGQRVDEHPVHTSATGKDPAGRGNRQDEVVQGDGRRSEQDRPDIAQDCQRRDGDEEIHMHIDLPRGTAQRVEHERRLQRGHERDRHACSAVVAALPGRDCRQQVQQHAHDQGMKSLRAHCRDKCGKAQRGGPACDRNSYHAFGAQRIDFVMFH